MLRRMDRARRNYLGINVIGGVAVLGSCAHGLLTHPGQGGLLWGSMPGPLVSLHVGLLPLAVAGHLAAAAFLLRAPPGRLTIGGAPALPQLSFSTAVLLLASAWWMPLCWAALDQQDPGYLQWIQLVLMVAGATALLNVVLLLRLDDVPGLRLRWAAVIGASIVMLQCTILDAFVWPRYFGIG